MNYSHAFHAGNFADVVKHAALTRILLHLGKKPAPFRVLDIHAGAGLYNLAGEAAARTGEWREGVGRLGGIDPASPAGVLLAPWRAIVGPIGPQGGLYPGSPLIARALMRADDRAVFCETQPAPRAALRAAVGRDRRVKVLDLDGWTALKAMIPPPERRGLVLIDPPFEAPDEFQRLAAAFLAARAKWPTGVLVAWHPTKDLRAVETFHDALRVARAPGLLRIDCGVGPVSRETRLARATLVVANPPWTLAEEMAVILPALSAAMAGPGADRPIVDWIAPPA